LKSIPVLRLAAAIAVWMPALELTDTMLIDP
jgi:hypothetical protein